MLAPPTSLTRARPNERERERKKRLSEQDY